MKKSTWTIDKICRSRLPALYMRLNSFYFIAFTSFGFVQQLGLDRPPWEFQQNFYKLS